MLIVLSHSIHKSDALERREADGRAEFFWQPYNGGVTAPLPADVRRRAAAIIHFAANSAIDGTPSDYPRVRAVLRSGVGFDKIDLAAWGRRGVPVFNVPDYGVSEVADHAIALMLALARGTATYHDAIRANPVKGWLPAGAPLVRRLRDCTFGVVGLGRIGLAAAQRARAFGMSIAFYDPYLPSGTEITVGACRAATLNDLMAMSDIVSIHAPGNEETKGMIGAAAFGAARRGLILINTARGSIVDLDALGAALRARKIAAAGLDVLPKEPADAAHPLIAAWMRREPWIAQRLTLSPHAAYYSPASVKDMRRFGLRTILNFIETGALANCVNPHVLKRARA